MNPEKANLGSELDLRRINGIWELVEIPTNRKIILDNESTK